MTEIDDSLESIRAVLTGEARIRANLIRKETNIILDLERSLLEQGTENIEDPEFIRRVNLILGIEKTPTILEPSPASKKEEAVSEWVTAAKNELLMGHPTSQLKITPATHVVLESHHALETASFAEVVLPPKNVHATEHSPKLGLQQQEVKVSFAGLEFSGRLIAEDGQYCNVAFPDGRTSRVAKSQLIR